MIYEKCLILTQNLKSTFIYVNVKRKFYLTLMLKKKGNVCKQYYQKSLKFIHVHLKYGPNQNSVI